jgi:hypothetical protein
VKKLKKGIKMVLGIDPGWKNLGIAGIEDNSLVFSLTKVPSSLGITGFIKDEICGIINKHKEISLVVIERYVAYEGVHNPVSEDILMLIGALQYFFEDKGIEVKLIRAIDWKNTLARYLSKNFDFSNPSTSFDKAFSLASAEKLSGITVKTDHEADAICLGFLGDIWKKG